MERRRLGIVIPALNEANTISAVVALAKQRGITIVVDDGSQDATADIARKAGAEVVSHLVNRGYDEALNSGFAEAFRVGCEYVITLDADGQHDTAALDGFVAELDSGADVVVGVRDRRQRMAETVFAWVSRVRWGIRDPLCGMKAYRIEVWRRLGHFDSYRSIGTELAIFAAVSGMRVRNVPVKTRPRADGARFGGALSANTRIARALWLGISSRAVEK